MHPIWAEILGCFRVEEAGSECEEPRVAGDSSPPVATTSRLPRFCLFPGTPLPTPRGRSHWDLETSPELGLRLSAQIKNFGPRPPGRGVLLVGRLGTSARGCEKAGEAGFWRYMG